MLAVLPLDIYPKKRKSWSRKDICILMFVAVLFTIPKTKNGDPKCPLTNESIKKLWNTYIQREREKYIDIRVVNFFSLFIVNIISGIAKSINRSWNRKFHPFFSHRDTNLITTCGPKYLYKNSRNQLRVCSTPGECKAKNKPRTVALKLEEEPFHFANDLSFPKPAQVTSISREHLACSLLLKGE